MNQGQSPGPSWWVEAPGAWQRPGLWPGQTVKTRHHLLMIVGMIHVIANHYMLQVYIYIFKYGYIMIIIYIYI